jgi:hypothetical protein
MVENIIGKKFCGKIPQSLEAPGNKFGNTENILNTALISSFSQESIQISFNSSCKILLPMMQELWLCFDLWYVKYSSLLFVNNHPNLLQAAALITHPMDMSSTMVCKILPNNQ